MVKAPHRRFLGAAESPRRRAPLTTLVRNQVSCSGRRRPRVAIAVWCIRHALGARLALAVALAAQANREPMSRPCRCRPPRPAPRSRGPSFRRRSSRPLSRSEQVRNLRSVFPAQHVVAACEVDHDEVGRDHLLREARRRRRCGARKLKRRPTSYSEVQPGATFGRSVTPTPLGRRLTSVSRSSFVA